MDWSDFTANGKSSVYSYVLLQQYIKVFYKSVTIFAGPKCTVFVSLVFWEKKGFFFVIFFISEG